MSRSFWSYALVAVLGLVLVTGVYAEKPKEGKKAPETKEKVKNAAPAFTLPDVDGKKHSLESYRGKVVVLEWINHGCPFVKKHYSAGTMQKLQKTYGDKGVVWLSICSSAPGKQGHMKPEKWKQVNKKKGTLAKAVLLDPDGKVGRLYDAKKTPHMYVIDKKGAIVYRGAIDDRPRAFRPEEIREARNYVAEALNAVMAGKKPKVAKTEAYGCTVKYP
jgi:peroxiredoxin